MNLIRQIYAPSKALSEDWDWTAVLSKDDGAMMKRALLNLLYRHFHEFVKQRDHAFPEELELETARQDGVPVFFLFLGS